MKEIVDLFFELQERKKERLSDMERQIDYKINKIKTCSK